MSGLKEWIIISAFVLKHYGVNFLPITSNQSVTEAVDESQPEIEGVVEVEAVEAVDVVAPEAAPAVEVTRADHELGQHHASPF